MKHYQPRGLPMGAPLVVVLHGCTQTGEGYAASAGWLDLADRYGFAVLAPEQTRANNPNLCFNWYEQADRVRRGGEAASIAQMVRFLLDAGDLDASRVFVTGLSAGGAMTNVMLATYPELFAGGAIIAGLPYGTATGLGEALGAMMNPQPQSDQALGDHVRFASSHAGDYPKVSIWHGQADTTVRPAAGEASARQWRNIHGATGPALAARSPGGRVFDVWTGPDGEVAVELHRMAGMGHGTPVMVDGPDGCGLAAPYFLDVGVSSSVEISQGWGIATVCPETASRTRSEDKAVSATPRVAAMARPIAGGADRVGQIIEQALRTAGLMP